MLQTTIPLLFNANQAKAQSGLEYDPNDPATWPPCPLCDCDFDEYANCCCGGVDICDCITCGEQYDCGEFHVCCTETCMYCQKIIDECDCGADACGCSICHVQYDCNDGHTCEESYCFDCQVYYIIALGHTCPECFCYDCWNSFPCYENHQCECYCNDCQSYYICDNGHTCDSGSGGGSSGGGGSGGGGGTTPPSGTPSSQAATRILANSNITPAERHANNHHPVDDAVAKQNLIDVKNGLLANRSSYTDGGRTGPGGETSLSVSLLDGIEYLAARFDIDISEIAGGVHSSTSSHYDGNTMDVNYVDGVHVSNMTSSQCQAFEQGCRDAGATYILKESTHYHIKF